MAILIAVSVAGDIRGIPHYVSTQCPVGKLHSVKILRIIFPKVLDRIDHLNVVAKGAVYPVTSPDADILLVAVTSYIMD